MNDMKDIISWLREIEQMAGDTYQKAAAVYADDIKLKKLLDRSFKNHSF